MRIREWQDKTTCFRQLEIMITGHSNRSYGNEIFLKDVLKDMVATLSSSQRVLLVTGFFVKGPDTGETDGPIGTLSLCQGLAKLGKETKIVTDRYSAAYLESCLERLQLKTEIVTVTVEDAKIVSERVLSQFNPHCVIAIERPGKGKDGRYYSMTKEDLTQETPDLDYLFQLAKERNITTGGIGDGGNEIGMGRIWDLVARSVVHGETIGAQTETDHLLVASVSNWGAHAVCAGLSILHGKDLMYEESMERSLIDCMCANGAVDGIQKKVADTIDGIDIKEHLKVYGQIKRFVAVCLNREDNMKIIVVKNEEQMDEAAITVIKDQLTSKSDSVLGLATGSTPKGLYKRLVDLYQKGELDFSSVTTFNLDEYYPIAPKNSQSYHYYMYENLFNQINVSEDRINLVNGLATDIQQECERYESAIWDAGGIDLQILGIGGNGHIGFNEPDVKFKSKTHLVALDEMTIQANSRFFDKEEAVPREAITMGMKSILNAKKILLMAKGEGKADAVKNAIQRDITPQCPASILQLHREVTVILDEAAAKYLSN